MTSQPDMSLVITDDVAFVRVQGEVDLANAAQLLAIGDDAIRGTGGTVRIDLSEVTFMDSTGLTALLAIQRRADDKGRRLILERPSPRVRKVLDITGLAGTFAIE
jgi:anti-sigma B factor antagonist